MKRSILKRIRVIVGLAVFLGLLSCSESETGALAFQNQECRWIADCRVKATAEDPGGDYVIEILHHPDGSGELIFLSPETIAGCKYYRTPSGQYSFQADDLLFPVAENPTTAAIFGLFSLSEDDLVKAKTAKDKEEGINLLTFHDGIMLYLNRDGMPVYYDHPSVTLTIKK